MSHHIPLGEYQPSSSHIVSPHGSRWTVPLLTLFALGSLARSSVAQDPPLVGIGSRVRLTLQGAQSPTVIGQLMEFGPDSLTIAGKKARDRKVLLRSTVRQVEVSLRQESRIARGLARGAVFGTLLSGAFALVLTGVTPSCDEASTSSGWQWCHTTTNLLASLGLGAAAGAVMGGVQAAEHPRDVWTAARWRDGVAPPPPSSKPLPLIGFGTVGDHRVLLIGLSFSR
jgi:hypothetical protein